MSSQFALILAVVLFPGGLFTLVLGLALKGVDRRVAARLQGRIGPPLLQPFFDVIKLGFKRTMIPESSLKTLFLFTPLAGVISMLLAAALVPISGVYTPDPMIGNLFVLLYLLMIPAIVLMIGGSVSSSPYGAIGFSREMALMIAYEGPLVLVCTAVAIRTGVGMGGWANFSLTDIIAYQQTHGAFLFDPVMWPAVIAFLVFFPANVGIIPFDIPEAETEVLEGPLLEYSGPALALFKVMSAIKKVVVLSLGIALFFPLAPDSVIGGLLVWLIKVLIMMVIGITGLRVAMGRMRIDQAFMFFLKWPMLFAVASLAVVVVV